MQLTVNLLQLCSWDENRRERTGRGRGVRLRRVRLCGGGGGRLEEWVELFA